MSRALTHLLMSTGCLLMASILTWHDRGGAAAARRMAKHFRLTTVRVGDPEARMPHA
jgi:hypothetical protein